MVGKSYNGSNVTDILSISKVVTRYGFYLLWYQRGEVVRVRLLCIL